MARGIIEGYEFHFLYDYDKDKLRKLSDRGKIEWFKQRMNFVFLNPIKVLWSLDSEIYSLINTPDKLGIEHRGFNLSIFCTVLSGVESYGAFLRGATTYERENKVNFCEYIKIYMKEWHKCIHFDGKPKHMVDLLWDHCRNAVAHGFRITNIGINHVVKNEENEEINFGIVDGIPMINCVKFFNDFIESTASFYTDLESNKVVRNNFIKTYNVFYS